MTVNIETFKDLQNRGAKLYKFAISLCFCQIIKSNEHFLASLRLLEILFQKIVLGAQSLPIF